MDGVLALIFKSEGRPATYLSVETDKIRGVLALLFYTLRASMHCFFNTLSTEGTHKQQTIPITRLDMREQTLKQKQLHCKTVNLTRHIGIQYPAETKLRYLPCP
jgi:hypothetical protein